MDVPKFWFTNVSMIAIGFTESSNGNKYKKICTRRLGYHNDVCIILLSQKNQVQTYSIVSRGETDLVSLPLLEAIPMNKELMMTSRRKVKEHNSDI